MNISDAAEAPGLFETQNDVIDLMASGAPLNAILLHIARLVERLAPPALCSIVLLDTDGRHLRAAAAPSLPEAYQRALDGVEIGAVAGSCGTRRLSGPARHRRGYRDRSAMGGIAPRALVLRPARLLVDAGDPQ